MILLNIKKVISFCKFKNSKKVISFDAFQFKIAKEEAEIRVFRKNLRKNLKDGDLKEKLKPKKEEVIFEMLPALGIKINITTEDKINSFRKNYRILTDDELIKEKIRKQLLINKLNKLKRK